jgi:hypothetical protein
MAARALDGARRVAFSRRSLGALWMPGLRPHKGDEDRLRPDRRGKTGWQGVFDKVARRLRGAVFSPALFDRVVTLARE